MSNSLGAAIRRVQPQPKIFRTLTCVTGNTAQCDIFRGDYFFVVDDVLPRGSIAAVFIGKGKHNAAINAGFIPIDD